MRKVYCQRNHLSSLTSDGVMSSNGSFSVRCVWEGGALIRRGHLFNISSQKEVANYKGGGNSRVYGNNLMSMVHSDIVLKCWFSNVKLIELESSQTKM